MDKGVAMIFSRLEYFPVRIIWIFVIFPFFVGAEEFEYSAEEKFFEIMASTMEQDTPVYLRMSEKF